MPLKGGFNQQLHYIDGNTDLVIFLKTVFNFLLHTFFCIVSCIIFGTDLRSHGGVRFYHKLEVVSFRRLGHRAA